MKERGTLGAESEEDIEVSFLGEVDGGREHSLDDVDIRLVNELEDAASQQLSLGVPKHKRGDVKQIKEDPRRATVLSNNKGTIRREIEQQQ